MAARVGGVERGREGEEPEFFLWLSVRVKKDLTFRLSLFPRE